MLAWHQPDLTLHPPRSPHVRLGGYVHLPRLLDKSRAHLTGRTGDYHFDCPLDAPFWAFSGLAPVAWLEAVRTGRTDTEMLAWVHTHAPRAPADTRAWSRWMESLSPGDAEMHVWFAEELQRLAPERQDIATYFDLLDLDDAVSFGLRG
jgi:hypothetical protein